MIKIKKYKQKLYYKKKNNNDKKTKTEQKL
jgi:hypothetical protein